ncbi:MAG: YraN family protein [Candidatus Shapirobacteria bacterium]|nr:YraN family protein [Candidatus Shapirobacteria bacterium]
MNYKNKIQNYKKGREGEEIAREYLIKKGFRLIESNYSNKLGEIDLIMVDKDILIFVEVKLKIGDRFGTPEEMINKYKLSRIKRIAEGFLVLEKVANNYQKYRIDAVCIVLDGNKKVERINHYENVQL